jgi:hypothetical protein
MDSTAALNVLTDALARCLNDKPWPNRSRKDGSPGYYAIRPVSEI